MDNIKRWVFGLAIAASLAVSGLAVRAHSTVAASPAHGTQIACGGHWLEPPCTSPAK